MKRIFTYILIFSSCFGYAQNDKILVATGSGSSVKAEKDLKVSANSVFDWWQKRDSTSYWRGDATGIFYTSNAVERIRINNDGRVNIGGVTNRASKLNVSGAVHPDSIVLSTTGGYSGLHFDGTNMLYTTPNVSNHVFRFNNTERARFGSGGELFLSPAYQNILINSPTNANYTQNVLLGYVQNSNINSTLYANFIMGYNNLGSLNGGYYSSILGSNNLAKMKNIYGNTIIGTNNGGELLYEGTYYSGFNTILGNNNIVNTRDGDYNNIFSSYWATNNHHTELTTKIGGYFNDQYLTYSSNNVFINSGFGAALGEIPETITITAVNTSTNTLTISPALPTTFVGAKHFWVLSNATGTFPAPITNSTQIEFEVINTTTIKLVSGTLTGTQTGGIFKRYRDNISNTISIGSTYNGSNEVNLGGDNTQEVTFKNRTYRIRTNKSSHTLADKGKWLAVGADGIFDETDVLLAANGTTSSPSISSRNFSGHGLSFDNNNMYLSVNNVSYANISSSGITTNGLKITNGAAANTYWKGDATGAGTWAAITKSDVGLSLVNNTADLDKPISTATQTALNGKANASHTHIQSDIVNLTTDLAAKASITYVNSENTTQNTAIGLKLNSADYNNIYLGNGSLSSSRVLTMNAFDLNFSSTTGNINFGGGNPNYSKFSFYNDDSGKSVLSALGIAAGITVDAAGAGSIVNAATKTDFTTYAGVNYATIDISGINLGSGRTISGLATTGAAGNQAISVTQAKTELGTKHTSVTLPTSGNYTETFTAHPQQTFRYNLTGRSTDITISVANPVAGGIYIFSIFNKATGFSILSSAQFLTNDGGAFGALFGSSTVSGVRRFWSDGTSLYEL